MNKSNLEVGSTVEFTGVCGKSTGVIKVGRHKDMYGKFGYNVLSGGTMYFVYTNGILKLVEEVKMNKAIPQVQSPKLNLSAEEAQKAINIIKSITGKNYNYRNKQKNSASYKWWGMNLRNKDEIYKAFLDAGIMNPVITALPGYGLHYVCITIYIPKDFYPEKPAKGAKKFTAKEMWDGKIPGVKVARALKIGDLLEVYDRRFSAPRRALVVQGISKWEDYRGVKVVYDSSWGQTGAGDGYAAYLETPRWRLLGYIGFPNF